MSSASKVGRVVFIRHGESVWNVNDPVRNLVARFTGWADVELTSHGRLQAAAAGRCLKMFGLVPDAVYTSLLRRSRNTYDEMSRVANIFHCPVINTWRLNERHYGSLQGLSKRDSKYIFDKELLAGWRRSWNLAPPPMDHEEQFYWRGAPWAQPVTIISEPGKKSVRAQEKGVEMPLTESLEDCAKRVKPIWLSGIAPRVARGETVLVVAHANSIRSMIRHIDNATLSDEDVRNVHIPAATPLVYTFELKNPTLKLGKLGAAVNAEVVRSLRPLGEPSKLGITGRYLASKEVVQLALESFVPKEDEVLKEKTTFFDLVEKGLADIMGYADEEGKKKDAVIVMDGRGVIIHANNVWESLYGLPTEEMTGKKKSFLKDTLSLKEDVDKLDEKLRTGLPAKIKVINYLKDGAAVENSMTIVPVYDWLDEGKDKSSRGGLQHLDYSGSDENMYREYSAQIMHPSHFIARLDHNPNYDA